MWCWAATASMIFQYYRLPNINPGGDFQCGIVAVTFPAQCAFDCRLCLTGIGTMDRMQFVINNYGAQIGLQYGVSSRNLTSSITFNSLTFEQVAAEIDAGRPVVAGISPGGFSLPNLSEHVALIVGYETNGSVPPRLVVNDPYPFTAAAFGGQPDPYLVAGGHLVRLGQYSIAHSAFVSQLRWMNTLYNVR